MKLFRGSKVDQTDPPQRRRRRVWIVLAVALCFGAGVGWYYLPRGDARFVGRWTMLEKDDSEPVGELTLQRHGMGWYTAPGGEFFLSFRWRVEDGNFVIGSKSTGMFAQRLEELAELLMEYTGRSFLPSEETYAISNVAEDEIKLQEDGSLLRLKRVGPK